MNQLQKKKDFLIYKKFRYKLEKVNKVVYDIYIQIDDIKVTYDLTEEEINRFSVLNKNLEEINVNYKNLLEQGKSKKIAYTKLHDDLETIELKLSRLQDDLDYQLKSITSMKNDEFRHEDLGQLNAYVSYYKKNEMIEGDNPPVGILLCGRNYIFCRSNFL